MTTESIKLKNSIAEKFERVRLDSFDESDIKALLIDIREYIRDQTLLRELADFIAHPKRDKGICHKLLNARYAKLSLFQEQVNRVKSEGGFEKFNIKTEHDFSSIMLSSVSTDRIKSDLFRVLFADGIEDIDEKLFKQYYKVGRNVVSKLISDSYFLSDGHYILKNVKQRDLIDDLLKFIRGTVTGKPAFELSAFKKELENSIKRIVSTFSLDAMYVKAFKDRTQGILLCIMCLLHDARLTFYDKKEGRILLTTKENFLALSTDQTVFHFYLFISDLKITDFIETLPDDWNATSDLMRELPWINARRNTNNKLVLTA
jgi:hypothetical protein